ncbi:F-box/kelch-repeat protein At1g57790-like [Rutidosis leptorrhynchoides]|uniref:F-box/kelch-repeat protein At1g57790-like n=1 Tax=Rutidosis leptorrhynchoides TaxID=125765 RepID=UPI003A9A18AF
MQRMETNRMRSWSDLPVEILSTIANRLELIELLSFRGTCKEFRVASYGLSAEIESSKPPWLLFHKPNTSECLIYNERESKTYKGNIPELEGAICLASYQGWLLLSKHESVYFFCPFSVSKIVLPSFPHKQLENHTAAFSDVPTSPNCIVCVINPIDDLFFEVNLIYKGKNEWTQHKINRTYSFISNVFAATFDDKEKCFYFQDNKNSVVTFSVIDKKSADYMIVSGDSSKDIETLPYSYRTHMLNDKIGTIRQNLDLEDDEYVDVRGLTCEYKKYPILYLNEIVDVSPTKTRLRRALWIQPRFYKAHSDRHW